MKHVILATIVALCGVTAACTVSTERTVVRPAPAQAYVYDSPSTVYIGPY